MIIDLERILRVGRQIAEASSAVAFVGNPPIVPQLLKAALEKEVTPVLRAESEDLVDGLANKLL